MRYTKMDEIAVRHRTDKSSGWHNYIEHYERHLRHLVDDEFTLLELGVGPADHKGASLYTWRDYFPKARIVGVDIRPDAADVAGDRISIEIGDCSDASFLAGLVEKHRPTVVIDDASHIWSHQILALRTIIPLMRSDGIFIMEDLHTSYGKFRTKPMFANQNLDTSDLILALCSGVLGSRLDHPRFREFDLSDEDLAALKRITEIAIVRSSAIMRIEDSPVPAPTYKI